MSLRDGTKKMSKSDASDQSRINLTDDPEAIALKIRRAKTDPDPLPHDGGNLSRVGVALQCRLGEDQFAVEGHLEAPA